MGDCLEMGELSYYIKVFLEILHDAALEKNLVDAPKTKRLLGIVTALIVLI